MMAIPTKIVGVVESEYERDMRAARDQQRIYERQLAYMQNNPYAGQLNQAAQMMNQAAQHPAPAPAYLDRRLLLLL